MTVSTTSAMSFNVNAPSAKAVFTEQMAQVQGGVARRFGLQVTTWEILEASRLGKEAAEAEVIRLGEVNLEAKGDILHALAMGMAKETPFIQLAFLRKMDAARRDRIKKEAELSRLQGLNPGVNVGGDLDSALEALRQANADRLASQKGNKTKEQRESARRSRQQDRGKASREAKGSSSGKR